MEWTWSRSDHDFWPLTSKPVGFFLIIPSTLAYQDHKNMTNVCLDGPQMYYCYYQIKESCFNFTLLGKQRIFSTDLLQPCCSGGIAPDDFLKDIWNERNIFLFIKPMFSLWFSMGKKYFGMSSLYVNIFWKFFFESSFESFCLLFYSLYTLSVKSISLTLSASSVKPLLICCSGSWTR